MLKCLQIICAKYYDLRYMFHKKLHLVKVGAFAWCSIKIHVIFGVQFERRKVDKKSKPTWKLKHANSILDYFEYFCQMSSKSILKILRYTVSKFARFFWDSVDNVMMYAADIGIVGRAGQVPECVWVIASPGDSSDNGSDWNSVHHVY